MSSTTTSLPGLAQRTPAHCVITPELLAAFTRAPLELARRVHREWFIALRYVCDCGLVVVFDDIVVGPPDPHVLEVAHHLRTFRRAELNGDFDDFDDDFDDLGGECDPPDIPSLVIDGMQRYQQAERLLSGRQVARVVQQILQPTRAESFHLVVLGLTAEHLLADVADLVRVGQGMVADARPEEAWMPSARLGRRLF